MRGKIKIILWVCLILSLLLMYSGFALRFANEKNNNSVVTVADYKEFKRSADKAHMGMGEILRELKDGGVKTLGVKELTLEDLAYKGEIYVRPLGEFLSSLQQDYPGLRNKVEAYIGPENINPAGYLVVTRDETIASFLKERLGRRFDGSQFTTFDIEGQTYFYIKAEIDDELKLGLGFDMEEMKKIKQEGFDILLLPRNSPGSNSEYLGEYEEIIKDFGIKYIIFDGFTVTGFPDNLNSVKDIILENNIIFGIIEAATQIKYVEQEGIEELIAGSGYSINRAYVAPESYLLRLDDEEMFFQWLRGVVDRNIRFIYVSPLKNIKSSYSENINSTIQAVKSFNSFIASKGYTLDRPIVKLSSRVLSSFFYLVVTLSLLFAGLLYLLYLPGVRLGTKSILVLTVLGAASGIVLNLVLKADIAKPLALCAAILYPSFSSLLILRCLKNGSGKKTAVQIVGLLGIMLGVNALGMYSIVSTLSHISYTMNVDMFRGVKVSFVIPLVLFAVNYMFCFVGYGRVREFIIKLFKLKVTYLAALIFLVGAAGLYLYIGRSGNLGVSASSLELKVREIFEKLLGARPRFKEFLIGYPALFLLVYLYNKYKKEVIVFILGMGVAVGSISMINSFSHVFTAITVSAARTFNGLVIGIIAGTAAVIVLDLLIKIFLEHRDLQIS
jgi:hypothetical protein